MRPVHDLENRPMSPRRLGTCFGSRSQAMAMLMAGCGSAREAGPTEPSSKVDAGRWTPQPAAFTSVAGEIGPLAYGVDGDIYVADWDGSNPVRIADGSPHNDCVTSWLGEYWGEGPIWSPDGGISHIATRTATGPEETWRDVVISDPEGNVVAGFPADGWDISWSPDSTRVAVWLGFVGRRSACSASTASGRR